MAFAVEPYIFDWIFFDDSSLSKLGGLELQGERQQNVPLGCISLPPIGSVCAIYFLRGRLCCLFSKGQPRPRCWISKCSACAFLWTYPEIRTCSIESWWHSSLRAMHHPRRSNSLLAGRKKLPKPTRLSSADSTHQ